MATDYRKSLFLIIFAAYLLLFSTLSNAGSIRRHKIKKLFKHSGILNGHFTGFALYDLDKNKMIFELNADKYFTPASNTKLFTWYTCLRMLGDSIPALKYAVHGDSLIFWGTGDPAFLHSGLKGVNGFNFLKNSSKRLCYAAGNYTGGFFGSGWAWDDYNGSDAAEISELPVENNIAELYIDVNGQLKIKPAILQPYLKQDSDYKPVTFYVQRDVLSNKFIYPAIAPPKDYKQEIPWKTSDGLTLELLQDTLKKEVTAISMAMKYSTGVIYDANADTVYKHMLQPSDNFIAEQLLLVCSSTRFDVLSTDSVIRYSKTHYLNDLPDEPHWIDGSGLSRYNMFTPRSIVALLIKLLALKDEQLLHSLLPQGGVTGTIKNAYKTDNGQVFVWAKTGTLMYDYNQSGYLTTRKGKRLAFSFMNNNFTRPPKEVRDEMVKIMTFIHDNY